MRKFLLSTLFFCSMMVLLSGCDVESKQSEPKDSVRSQQTAMEQPVTSSLSGETFTICEDKISQLESNECAYNEFENSEKELEKLYQERYQELKAYMDESAMDNLSKSQETWKQYRDQFCLFVDANYEGGSIRPYMRSSCLNDVTRARIRALELYF